jgi:nitroreductase
MAVAEEPRVKELLGVPDDYAIAAVLPIGKPVTQFTKLTRKPVAEIASRERFDGEPFTA